MEQYVICGQSPLTALFMMKYRKTLLFLQMIQDPQLAHTLSEFLELPELLTFGSLNTSCLSILKIQSNELRILRAKIEYYEAENKNKNRMQVMMDFLAVDQNDPIRIHQGRIIIDAHQRVKKTIMKYSRTQKSKRAEGGILANPFQQQKKISKNSQASLQTSTSHQQIKIETVEEHKIPIKENKKFEDQFKKQTIPPEVKKQIDPATLMAQIQRRNARKIIMLERQLKGDQGNEQLLRRYREQMAKQMILQAKISKYARKIDGKLPSQMTREQKDQFLTRKLKEKNIPFVDRVEDIKKLNIDIIVRKETFFDRLKVVIKNQF